MYGSCLGVRLSRVSKSETGNSSLALTYTNESTRVRSVVEDDFGMRRNDYLPSAFASNLTDQVVYLFLQNDVLVCVGLVKQNYRSGPCVHESAQKKHLERSTPGT